MRDITKLPKWAQAHIDRLARRAADAEKALTDHEQNKPTRVILDRYMDSDEPVPYLRRRGGTNPSVFFSLDDDKPDEHTTKEEALRWEGIEVRLRRFRRRWVLELTGDDAIQLHPGSGNRAYVTIERSIWSVRRKDGARDVAPEIFTPSGIFGTKKELKNVRKP